MKTVPIICRDIDMGTDHHMGVTESEAEQISNIDPNSVGVVQLPSRNAKISVGSDGVATIWGAAPGGEGHWSANVDDLIEAARRALGEED